MVKCIYVNTVECLRLSRLNGGGGGVEVGKEKGLSGEKMAFKGDWRLGRSWPVRKVE